MIDIVIFVNDTFSRSILLRRDVVIFHKTEPAVVFELRSAVILHAAYLSANINSPLVSRIITARDVSVTKRNFVRRSLQTPRSGIEEK